MATIKKAAPKKKAAAKKPITIASKKKSATGNQEYLILKGVTGSTLIKPLEKKYKGVFKTIGGKNVIVREIKAAPKKKATVKKVAKKKTATKKAAPKRKTTARKK